MFPKKLIEMQNEFTKENTDRYLFTEESRLPYLTTFNNGQLFNADHQRIENENLLYVLDENERLFTISMAMGWNHSFFLAGGPVLAAGKIEIARQGEITQISNESGHYIPKTIDMLYALDYFYKQVEDTENSEFITYEGHDNAPNKFLQTYRLNDVVNLDPEDDLLEQLEEICIGTIFMTKKNQDSLCGYQCTEDLDLTPPTILSRYGMKPNLSLLDANKENKANTNTIKVLSFSGTKVKTFFTPMKSPVHTPPIVERPSELLLEEIRFTH